MSHDGTKGKSFKQIWILRIEEVLTMNMQKSQVYKYGRMAVLCLFHDIWQQLEGSKAVTTNKKLIHQVGRNKEKGNLGEREVATQQWIQRLELLEGDTV